MVASDGKLQAYTALLYRSKNRISMRMNKSKNFYKCNLLPCL